jgi:hypothetical protein
MEWNGTSANAFSHIGKNGKKGKKQPKNMEIDN